MGRDVRVAIVGTGPAGCYALQGLLSTRAVSAVSVIDRLVTPGGLIRAGVAPDHQETKKVFGGFARSMRDSRVRCFFGVDVGADISHRDLMAHHHAVLYATGASGGRRLGIPGEDLMGSHAATEFVGWYNGHPDHARRSFDLSGERAVVIGNGNVALDVARVLSIGTDALKVTDIADHALDALQHSSIRDVVILGRRGPEFAAFTTPELLALTQLDGVDVVVDPSDLVGVSPPNTHAGRLKMGILADVSRRERRHSRRIVMRFHAAPVAIEGADGRVAGVRIVSTRTASTRQAAPDEAVVDAGLVIRSIGYRGAPVTDLPTDDRTGVVHNSRGRVVPGVYAAGWFKRGPTGVIGTNKHDAAESVGLLLDDLPDLDEPLLTAADFASLISRTAPNAITMDGWTRIDALERGRGAVQGRPRVKMTDIDQMVTAARSTITVDR